MSQSEGTDVNIVYSYLKSGHLIRSPLTLLESTFEKFYKNSYFKNNNFWPKPKECNTRLYVRFMYFSWFLSFLIKFFYFLKVNISTSKIHETVKVDLPQSQSQSLT